MLIGVAVIVALGLDTGFLTRVSAASTTSIEQGLLDRFHPQLSGNVASAQGPAMMSG